MTHQVVKRGLLQSFDSLTSTAQVLLLEATSQALLRVDVATWVDGSSAVVGATCAVLFLDAQNQDDAVVIALYNKTPALPAGRMTFVPGVLQVNGVTINAGSTATFTLTGGSSGIPAGSLGILYHLSFSSSTGGAFVQMAPHGGSIGNYAGFGTLPTAGATLHGNGCLQLDGNGQADIKANVGNCTVSLYTHGYVF